MAQATSWTPTSWTPLSPAGKAPKPRNGRTATYCPTDGGGAMYIFGCNDGRESFGDLWRLDFQEQRWQLLKPAGPAPPAREGHSATFCASTDSIVVFGGVDDRHYRDDVWRFMIKDGRWQPATAGGGPEARSGHSAVSAQADAVLIFGGCGCIGKRFNDLWKLNAEATSWTPLSPTGEAPKPQSGHAATYCPTDGGGAMIVHGGHGGLGLGGSAAAGAVSGGARLADLWRLDFQANRWERLNPVGQGPSSRVRHSSILVPEINCLVVFGGCATGAELCNDLFTLDLADLKATSWTALSPTGEAPKPRYGHTATYCPTDGGGAMIVFGGQGYGGEYFGDLWRLDFQALAPAAPKALPTAAPAAASSGYPGMPKASETQASAEECIPDGSGASISMVSARFDGSAMEAKFRKVHELLTKHKFEVLMVDADAGDDFGDLTMEYLHRVEHEKGVMLAVCTAHYGEMTASKFSSHEEVKYARNQGLQVIPLRVVDTYPPEPPFGENHPHDKKGRARGYINAIFPPSKVFLDCRDKTAEQVAAMIGRRLLASRSKGHGSA